MEAPALQWSAAEVRDGALTVPVEGDQPDGWSDAFEHTVKLLANERWTEVQLGDGQVSVSGVHEGDEDTLHHFLDSVVTQANATVQAREAEAEAENEAQARDDASSAQGDGADETDVRMTERFRDIGGDGDEDA